MALDLVAATNKDDLEKHRFSLVFPVSRLAAFSYTETLHPAKVDHISNADIEFR